MGRRFWWGPAALAVCVREEKELDLLVLELVLCARRRGATAARLGEKKPERLLVRIDCGFFYPSFSIVMKMLLARQGGSW
jgi:hypothetical protein